MKMIALLMVGVLMMDKGDANRASKVGVSISKLPGEGVARTGG